MSDNIPAQIREIPKVYNPKSVEKRWYQDWLENGYFNSEVNPRHKPYTIVIPPPNVTSALHIGHAFNNTIQDLFIRYYRKQGKEALWLPGIDHAGIATQNVVEKELRKENLTRHDLGREKFVERVWAWKEKHGNTIIHQLKEMGCSCDWRRERFTRDERYTYAVLEAFIRLFNKGYIYRGNRIVNWDPASATALADEEVEHKEVQGKLYHIRYRFKDSDEYLTTATTRPETLLGDTAVAIAPDDESKQHLLGKTVIIPLVNREVPLIADEHVDKDFGSGFVKVTPAHDPNDFEIGQRHQLQQVLVLDRNASVLPVCQLVKGSEYSDELPVPSHLAGLDRFEARKKIVAELKRLGQLEKIEPHVHAVGHSYRSHVPVEPYLSTQWFVRMSELAKPALDAVVKGEIKLYPEEKWLKTYINWMENIHDWCISRQLWWGHRIPVYYCHDCRSIIARHQPPERCESCDSARIRQDEDVLDTWFSSWLWPFATMGWPEETPELHYFYPTDTLVTGPDIIFFWVARMIIAGYEFRGQRPFKDVYLNGIVRDTQGRKMSKSLDNGIDPLDIIDKYSADALRATLVLLSSEGQDINLAESDFEIGRNFSNKIWNAYRFLALYMDGRDDNYQDYVEHFELADRWILSRLNRAITGVTKNIADFHVNDSLNAVYHFFWDEYCDWYLELIKRRLIAAKDSQQKQTALSVAVHIMKACMNLLHPYVPFITEEIWQRLKYEHEESIVISPWPMVNTSLNDEAAEQQMQFLQRVITGIRTIRAEMNVPPASKARLLYRTENQSIENLLLNHADYLENLARVESIRAVEREQELKLSAVLVIDDIELFMPLADLIDIDLERKRIKKEISRLTEQLVGLQKKLSNHDFLQKAPENVVLNEKTKSQNFNERLKKLKANLERL